MIQQRLFEEQTLTFERAVSIASAMACATKNTRELRGGLGTLEQVNKLTVNKNIRKSENQNKCTRCDKNNHNEKNCYYRTVECRKCGKVGHLAKCCRTKETVKQKSSKPIEKTWQKKKQVHSLTSSVKEIDPEYRLFRIENGSVPNPIKEIFLINGKEVELELDTGSPFTLISRSKFKKISNEKIIKEKLNLTSFTGHKAIVEGYSNVQVNLNGKTETLKLWVLENEGPSLCGRDWILNSNLDILIKKSTSLDIKTLTQDNVTNELKLILSKHNDIFGECLGTLKNCKVHLWLKSESKPKFMAARQVPYSLKDKVSDEIDRLLGRGVLTPVSFSKYASPIVVKLKKDKTVRLCGDFKTTVNPNLDIECYPLPKIDYIFATLAGGEKFTKIDLRDAYNQLELDEESKEIVVINTQKGLYKYNRLPFGISSAPAVFQRVVDTLLKGIPMVGGFQDDIIITGKNNVEHLKSLEQVLTRLQEAGLKLKENKCEFMLDHVTYLGYKIDKHGLHPLPDRLRAIKDAPAPKSVEQLKAFIGTIVYYGKFIRNQATMFAPLYKLLEKEQSWEWNEEQEKAFIAAKEAICGSSVLVHYDGEKELILACDASPYGVGAVLSHPGKSESDVDRPIAFASRTLTKAEKGYSQLEKEALALIFGVTKFRDYLVCHTFTLQTDHQPLVSLLSEKKQIPRVAAARIQRWALVLAGYSYKLTYRKGKLHANADVLSRLPLESEEKETPNLEELVLLLKNVNTQKFLCDVDTVSIETKSDKTLSKVKQFIEYGWPRHIKEHIELDEMKNYFHKRLELSVEGEILLWGLRVIIPKPLRNSVLNELHDGHQGMSLMKALAREKVWWPGIDMDIEKHVSCCTICQQTADMPSANLHVPWPNAIHPWEKVHVDYAGPVEGKMILIVVDSYSKWMEAVLVSSATAQETTEELRRLFSRYGLPITIVSDNGTHFSGEPVDKYLKANGVKHLYIAPYHPASNGQAERAVRIVKKGLERLKLEVVQGLKNDTGPLHVRLERILLNYRRTPVVSTGKSPAELFLGRKIRTKIDLMNPLSARNTNESVNTKDLYNPGENVWIRNFGKGYKWLPGRVLEKNGNAMIKIQTEKGVMSRHHDQVRMDNRKDEKMLELEHGSTKREKDETAQPDTNGDKIIDDTSNTKLFPNGKAEIEKGTVSKTDDFGIDNNVVPRRSDRKRKPVVRMDL